jgi:hypothetical protein
MVSQRTTDGSMKTGKLSFTVSDTSMNGLSLGKSRLSKNHVAYWSRFTIKQTYTQLRAKRTFTPHVPFRHWNSSNRANDAELHGPQSVQHGWEWYEMAFFACWNRPGRITVLCFDMPAKSRTDILSLLVQEECNLLRPYSVFSVVSDAVVRLFDDSVWSIRNHISQWESVSLLL